MPFIFEKLDIPDLVLVKPRVFDDDRGFFMETYKLSDFREFGIDQQFIQDNHSKSSRGVLRGLHYQMPPFAQGKLIRCIQGEIWDVAVDIRRNSPSFGKWASITLSSENKQMLFVPEGFAHGFYTVSDTAEICYKVTAEYSREHDRGILWNDPEINIKWPDGPVALSDKDKVNPVLKSAEVF